MARDRHTQTAVTTIHFASSTTHAKCDNRVETCNQKWENWFESVSHTILKDPFNIQSISGTRLIVSTTFQVASELPGPGVVDESWVTLTDCVLSADEDDWNVGDVGVVLRHLGIV